MEEKIRHLGMIQGSINRMDNNSFLLKGWAVTLIAGIFALASKETDKSYFLIAYVPIIIFWGIDAYYLLQERLYISLYNKVRNLDKDKIDFSMKATKEEFNESRSQYLNVLFSPTEFWFYFPLAILSAGVIILTEI